MAGYQVGEVCYPTALEATQAVAARGSGNFVLLGSKGYIAEANTVTAGSIVWKFLDPTALAPGNVINRTYTVNLQPCNMLQSSDALELGWMVAGVWVATYAVLFMARAFRGETKDDYGNA